MSSGEDPRVRRARKKARGLGLTMRVQGDLVTLRKGNELIASGSLLTVETYLAAQHRNRGRAVLPSPWDDLITDYLLFLAAGGQTARTLETRRSHLVHVARQLQTRPDTLTATQLVQWFGRQTWAPETRKGYRSAVRGFLIWAGRQDLADALPKVRVPATAPKPVGDDAWEQAVAAAAPRTRLALRLAAEAGLRRAEVAQVNTRDLTHDPGGPSLRVHGKGGKVRVVPISDSLAAQIRAGAAGHTPGASETGWLFPNGFGSHIRPAYVAQLIKPLLPPGYSMHKLRARFATRAYRGTRNLRAVQTLLGHASVATTERYTAVDDDEIRAAALAAAQ